MGCGTKKEGEVAGCGSSGGCSSGGCNKHNTYDWLADIPLSFNDNFNIVEVSFKKGARKSFYRNTQFLDLHKGQLIVVEAVQGFDIGEVSLQGELVRSQMKKRKITERDDTIRNILRIANEQDINLYLDGRNAENELMVRARAIAKTHQVDMKIGDLEFQGDGKKLTIFYTAENRIDFRELVRIYARDFKVKIEMRQIGARQEAARIGGMGTCGRELCCSTWLHDFKTVTTNAVRYQNLALNTDKMSGQCGRLKCCLNYELDTYNDALKKFPRQAEVIQTEEGRAFLRKTEILKKQMIYAYEEMPGKQFKLSIETVAELLEMNKSGKKPASLENYHVVEEVKVDESKHDDLVGQVSLKALEDKARKNRNQQRNKPKPVENRNQSPKTNTNQPQKGIQNNSINSPKTENPKQNNPPRPVQNKQPQNPKNSNQTNNKSNETNEKKD